MTTILKTFQSQKDKFEVNKCITQVIKAISLTSWFYILIIHSQNESQSNLPTKLEITFLMGSGSSIPVPTISTYLMITPLFRVCSHDQHDKSKMLAIANQSEVPNKQ